MIQRYQYLPNYQYRDTSVQLLPAIAASLSAAINIFIMVILDGRMIELSHDFSKFTIVDLFVAYIGFFLSAAKMVLAIICAVLALSGKTALKFSILKLAGYITTGLNACVFIFGMVILLTVGLKDPNNLTFNLLLLTSIIVFLDTLASALYAITMKDPTPNPLMSVPYGYMPVYMPSANHMIPMFNLA